MKNSTHIMIDLETLGTLPDAPIIQIGAVTFTLQSESDFKEDVFNCLIKPSQGIFDLNTLNWWIKTNADFLYTCLDDGEDEAIVLYRFGKWLDEFNLSNKTVIWSWPTSFDIPILLSAFRRHQLYIPKVFIYTNKRSSVMCAKTLRYLHGKDLRPANPNKHNAISDCLAQIAAVRLMLSRHLI